MGKFPGRISTRGTMEGWGGCWGWGGVGVLVVVVVVGRCGSEGAETAGSLLKM